MCGKGRGENKKRRLAQATGLAQTTGLAQMTGLIIADDWVNMAQMPGLIGETGLGVSAAEKRQLSN